MNDALDPIPVIGGIGPLAADYDLMLCDVWGVLHNGRDVFAPAVGAARAFRETGGTVVLISNSPRPRPRLIEQLDGLGVARDAYDAVVTSGDVTRAELTASPGVEVFHLGPERDKGIFENLDLAFAPADEADVVVCSGLFDDTSETPEDYRDCLARLKELSLPMICANPDIQVERGDALVYCAGALAEAYERLGGEVVYTGKPHRPIYDLALAEAGALRGAEVAGERVFAVGDGLDTDMAGAAAIGVDALYVASGLHGGGRGSLDEGKVARLFEGRGARPIAALAELRW